MTRALGILVALLLVGCTTIPADISNGTSPPTGTRATLPAASLVATARATLAATLPPAPTLPPPPTSAPSSVPTPAETVAATDVPTAQPSTSGQPAASFSAEVAALLTHVPEHLRGDCLEVTSFDGGFLYGVQCINLPDIDGYVTYYQFDTSDNLNASYQGNKSFFAPDVTGTDCSVGPSENPYTVAGTETGRVFCADYDDGQILVWTSEPLTIESTIVLYGGSYPDLNGVWEGAGPLLGDVPASPAAEEIDWTTSAGAHRSELDQTFTYACPPDGSDYPVYGTDVYTDDSSVCTAAVHAGLITFAAGGSVAFTIVDGQDSYTGSERNGVTTNNWGSWDVSFIFVTS